MNSEDLAAIEKLQKRFERREVGSYSPYIKAVTDNASELISRARRAEELECEVQEWRDTVSGEPPTLLRRLLAVAQSHSDPLRGLLLRVWKREQELESENEQLREREREQRKQLNHIEAYCSDYVDDITTSHKMIRNICEVIGMEWEKRV